MFKGEIRLSKERGKALSLLIHQPLPATAPLPEVTGTARSSTLRSILLPNNSNHRMNSPIAKLVYYDSIREMADEVENCSQRTQLERPVEKHSRFRNTVPVLSTAAAPGRALELRIPKRPRKILVRTLLLPPAKPSQKMNRPSQLATRISTTTTRGDLDAGDFFFALRPSLSAVFTDENCLNVLSLPLSWRET